MFLFSIINSICALILMTTAANRSHIDVIIDDLLLLTISGTSRNDKSLPLLFLLTMSLKPLRHVI
jgi:hypothetical protein